MGRKTFWSKILCLCFHEIFLKELYSLKIWYLMWKLKSCENECPPWNYEEISRENKDATSEIVSTHCASSESYSNLIKSKKKTRTCSSLSGLPLRKKSREPDPILRTDFVKSIRILMASDFSHHIPHYYYLYQSNQTTAPMPLTGKTKSNFIRKNPCCCLVY
jgi:hypothetical protein